MSNDEDLAQKSLCEKLVRKHLGTSLMVTFLFGAMKEAGCPMSPNGIECIKCEDNQEGARFDISSKKIQICQNWIQSSTQVEDALSHELIHAYDDCRVQNFDDTNCKQVACSEIRAANLSGDCKWTRELMRGNIMNFAGAHNTCVRRRARLSMVHNKKACGNCNVDSILDEVWDACLADTAPFIEIP